jgi:signal transduction histidine kinase
MDKTVRLDQPLPDDVAVGSLIGFSRYRAYPVFSWPWWKGRTLFLGMFVVLYALLVVVAVGVNNTEQGWHAGVKAAGIFLGSFMLMVCLPTLLGVWVRRQLWPGRKEALGLILAITLGIGVSATVDYFASEAITQVSSTTQEKAERERRKAERTDTQLLTSKVVKGVFSGVVYFLLGGGVALIGYFRERQRVASFARKQELANARAARHDAEMRLSVLQAQVEPHFLFNTLASLRSLINSDPPRAAAMVDKLVDYLRASIPRMREDGRAERSTLQAQVAVALSYLELMAVRMGSRIVIEQELPDTILGMQFPPLMLISLVENAIKHGLEPKPEGGTVRLSAQQHEGKLRVTVSDNGVGLREGTSSGGIGLANIRSRLKEMYGSDAALELSTPAQGGFSASIVVPLQVGDHDA